MGLFGKRKMKQPPQEPYSAMVVVAAGKATRMGEVDKIMYPLCDLPVLGHSLLAMERSETVNEVVVVTRRENILLVGELCRSMGLRKVSKVIRGGESRVASALIGLEEISPQAQIAGIHDGARPCVSPILVDAVLRAASDYGAAVPGSPATDTLKKISSDRFASETLDRSLYVSVQTPQAFESALIRGALTKALHEGWDITDDCAAVERIGMRVKVVSGQRNNIKITVMEDIAIAEAIIRAESGEGELPLYRR